MSYIRTQLAAPVPSAEYQCQFAFLNNKNKFECAKSILSKDKVYINYNIVDIINNINQKI